MNLNVERALECLKAHHLAFEVAHAFALETDQVTPEDSRGWSQVLISLLTGIKGPARKKKQDFIDNSDVKAANTWGAIDTPRFNGVIKAGTKSKLAGKMAYLNTMPYLYLVLWDIEPNSQRKRVRIWVVQPQKDPLFRKMCRKWYKELGKGNVSTNFQLHPPRNSNSNLITNTFGRFEYPLLFSALWAEDEEEYELDHLDETALSTTKYCSLPKKIRRT